MGSSTETGVLQQQAEDFFISVSLLKNADEVKDFMFDIFTEAEVLRAAKRWCITQRLIEDNGSASVIESCGANKNTVSRARRTIVKDGSGICRLIYERLSNFKETAS
jgi:uncharacterized protein YerC